MLDAAFSRAMIDVPLSFEPLPTVSRPSFRRSSGRLTLVSRAVRWFVLVPLGWFSVGSRTVSALGNEFGSFIESLFVSDDRVLFFEA